MNKHDRKEGRSANIGFAKWQVKYFYDSLVQGSSSVFQMKFCAENPPLCKAENRLVFRKLIGFLTSKTRTLDRVRLKNLI